MWSGFQEIRGEKSKVNNTDSSENLEKQMSGDLVMLR